MNFKNRNYSYSEIYNEVGYDPYFIQMTLKKNFPYSEYVDTDFVGSSTLDKELMMFDSSEYSKQNVGGFSIRCIIRFKNKNNLLKFKLKSTIL